MSALPGRIAAAAAAVVFALCTGPAPAHAAPDLRLHLETVTLAPGGEPKHIPIWAAVPESGVYPVRFTVDYSGVAAFASVEPVEADYIIIGRAQPSAHPDSPCTAGTGRFTCDFERSLNARMPLPIGTLAISPKDGATTGSAGTLQITATLDGVERSVTSTVRVGTPVDLQAVETGPISAPAGDTAKTGLLVRNASAVAVDGVVLFLGADSRMLAPVTHPNCSADESGLVCAFDAPLAPGATYRLSEPLAFRPPADSVTGSRMLAAAHWTTATEWADMRSALGADPAGATPGTGSALTLVEVTAAAAGPQADVDDDDNWTGVVLDVTRGQRVDIAALGAFSTADVSDRTTVRIGLMNRGPGRLHPDLYVNNRMDIAVRIPRNTKVVSLPSTCSEMSDREFRCWSTAVPEPGRQHVDAVTLRVTKGGRGAGQVETVPVDPQLPRLADPDSANDVAPLVITGTGGTESLPITGAGGTAALGLSLLILGGFSRLVARRRSGAAG